MAEGRRGSPMCLVRPSQVPPAPHSQEAGLHLGIQRGYNRFGDHIGLSAKHRNSHYRWGDIKSIVLTPSLALSELQQRLAGRHVCSRCLSGCQPLALRHSHQARGWQGSLQRAGPLVSTVPGEQERAVPPSGPWLSPCLLRALL